MGTSTNQRSPNTTNWRAVAGTYQSEVFPVERVVQELWRAAQSDPESDWRELLKSPPVFLCQTAATQFDNAFQALQSVSRDIARLKLSSLAADLSKRALTQSLGQEVRSESFAEALFAEVTSYLVARDLPGYVGVGYRSQTATQANEFAAAVRDRVANEVRRVPTQRAFDDLRQWQGFVNDAVDRLAT